MIRALLKRLRPPEPDAETLMARARALAEAGDHEAALALWGPLAHAGVPRAQNNVGSCFAHGQGVPVDHALALRWLTLAAEAGDPLGQRNLGIVHYNGLGVPLDYAEAARWFRLAAEGDDGEAQDMLSFMLLDGEMIEPDFVEARRWAQAAADKGYPGAATRLGSIYYDAHGTERDTAAAVHWWRVASDGGDGDGAALLGAALHLGQGAPENQEDAYRYLLLAERRGSTVAARYLPSVRERLASEVVRSIEAEGSADAALSRSRRDRIRRTAVLSRRDVRCAIRPAGLHPGSILIHDVKQRWAPAGGRVPGNGKRPAERRAASQS